MRKNTDKRKLISENLLGKQTGENPSGKNRQGRKNRGKLKQENRQERTDRGKLTG